DESLLASAQGLRRLRETYAAIKDRLEALGAGDAERPEADEPAVTRVDTSFSAARAGFAAAMTDDLNTPRALAALFDANREIRKSNGDGSSACYLAGAAALVVDLLSAVLGVPLQSEGAEEETTEALGKLVELLLEQRQQARLRRDFVAA